MPSNTPEPIPTDVPPTLTPEPPTVTAEAPIELPPIAPSPTEQPTELPPTELPPTEPPASTSQMLLDFEDGGEARNWFIVNDTVMGGVSSSQGGINNGTLIFIGNLSLANNGGFTSVRRNFSDSLEGFTGVRLNVRGDGRSYILSFRDVTDGIEVAHEVLFSTVANSWTVIELPFQSFVPTFRGVRINRPALDTTQLRGMGIALREKNEGQFQLEIDYIEAYR